MDVSIKLRGWLDNRVVKWGCLIGWMLLIFLVSHQPKTSLPEYGVWDWLVKKGAHFIAYGILAWLAYRVLNRPWWALGLAFLYAISDEWHQTFVPGRIGSPTDVIIDTLGALTTLVVQHQWGAKLPRWGQTDKVAPP